MCLLRSCRLLPSLPWHRKKMIIYEYWKLSWKEWGRGFIKKRNSCKHRQLNANYPTTQPNFTTIPEIDPIMFKVRIFPFNFIQLLGKKNSFHKIDLDYLKLIDLIKIDKRFLLKNFDLNWKRTSVLTFDSCQRWPLGHRDF